MKSMSEPMYKSQRNSQLLEQESEATNLHSKGVKEFDEESFPNAILYFDNEITGRYEILNALESEVRARYTPKIAEAHYSRGTAFYRQNMLKEAIKDFDLAIANEPDNFKAQFNKSFSLLLNGDFEEGWKFYESRWKTGQIKLVRVYEPIPLWLGIEPLQGKTILLHAEQGQGDAIQFCRYAKLVSNKGAKVIINAFSELEELFKTLDCDILVISREDDLPMVDYRCPLMSLPLALKIEKDKGIPFPQGYLKSDSSKLAEWKDRLGLWTKPRIGLAWSGGVRLISHKKRNIEIDLFIKALPYGFQYVTLQPDIEPQDLGKLKAHADKDANTDVLDFSNKINDFSDTAALIESLDVIISVDTSVAHLAGALGKTVWILLPFNPDWRWLLKRTDSLWYNSAKLYRQTEFVKGNGKWDDVLKKINRDLKEYRKMKDVKN